MDSQSVLAQFVAYAALLAATIEYCEIMKRRVGERQRRADYEVAAEAGLAASSESSWSTQIGNPDPAPATTRVRLAALAAPGADASARHTLDSGRQSPVRVVQAASPYQGPGRRVS